MKDYLSRKSRIKNVTLIRTWAINVKICNQVRTNLIRLPYLIIIELIDSSSSLNGGVFVRLCLFLYCNKNIES